MRSNPSKALLVTVLLTWIAVNARGDDRKDSPARPANTFAGHVEPAAQVGIYARVAATAAKVNVDIGDRVKKGDVVIELSAPELQSGVEEAQAVLVRAKAGVEQAEAATQAAKARLDGADAALHAAEDAYHRAASSAASVPGSVVDDGKVQLENAKAGASAAKAEVAVAEAGVKVAQAGAAAAEAGLRLAQTRLNYTRILAPFDGVVTRRLVDAGATVGPPVPGQTAPLLTVASTDPVQVVFDVDERGAARTAAGAPVVVRLASLPDVQLKGKVARTAGAINPDTGTLRVVVDLPNADGKLLPGMSAVVELPAGEAGK